MVNNARRFGRAQVERSLLPVRGCIAPPTRDAVDRTAGHIEKFSFNRRSKENHVDEDARHDQGE
ncbi:MAG: hypothetical protein RL756_426 [Pseudomonadota bacterium]|jgi:hypothetical protein